MERFKLWKGNHHWGSQKSITPNHPSYSDSGMGPPPKKWKGKCEVAGCNNKLIGFRSFITNGTGSMLDEEGHGTHTSSTAVGKLCSRC